jgi:hypothetical protein
VEQVANAQRFSVVFLSYQASMSDSLQSIRRAFAADPRADVYWVPVPYYELRPDRSAGDMRFDGPEHYPGIECTDYRTLDLQRLRPDAIFTFAPYDGYNTVTSVHPDFYCERLKDLTKLLVYVPYFVAVDHVPSHFCDLPGTRYADLVPLQSARIRDAYRSEFAKVHGDRFGDPEEKFVALGSAKFDEALAAVRDPADVPPELITEIGQRTVVLLNTTVSGLLASSQEWLRKLLSIMVAFSARDDVFVWWRPHPLTEATIKSMRPELLDLYRQVGDFFRGHVRGLQDDSEDVHRAVAWSDAYYGDWSSLIAFYTATGKPVMLSNVTVLPEDESAAPAGARGAAVIAPSSVGHPHAPFVRPPHTMHGPMDAIYHESVGADLAAYLDFVVDPAMRSDDAVVAMRDRYRQIFRENTTHAGGDAGRAIASYARWRLVQLGVA